MPRLLIVTTVAETLNAFLSPYADHFRSLGWNVDALANGAAGNEACVAHFDAIFDIAWSRGLLGNWRVRPIVKNLTAIVAAGNYDIVHVHTPVAAFLIRLAISRKSGKRPCVVYTAHGFHFQPGGNPVENFLFAAAEKLAGRWTDYLVTINETDRCAAQKMRLVSPDRLRFMPGIGLDRAWFSPRALSPEAVTGVRHQFGIPDPAPVFVMVAEFIPRKRHSDVVRAFAAMRNRDAHLIFVGGGQGREAVRTQAAHSGAAARIHFAGPQSDVRPFILAARAVILSSSLEGLPRCVMESLCCGIPVIGSDIRGTRDLLGNGGGSTYPCGDVRALTALLDWYAANPRLAEEIGLRGSQTTAPYDTSGIIRLHEDLYSEALQNLPSATPEPLTAHH